MRKKMNVDLIGSKKNFVLIDILLGNGEKTTVFLTKDVPMKKNDDGTFEIEVQVIQEFKNTYHTRLINPAGRLMIDQNISKKSFAE